MGANFIFILALVSALLLTSCGSKDKAAGGGAYGQRPQAVVSTVTVVPKTYEVTERFPGVLQANSIVQLRPDVTGYLEAIRVPDGSHVKKGQVLYAIDKSRYQASYNQAQANLQQVETDLAQKKQDLGRYQDLLKHDAISTQTVDQAASAVKSAVANVAAAKASLSGSATDLDHAIIKAPISGKIGIVQVKIGDIINAGQTLINTIVNDDPTFADIDVPQSRYREYSEGNAKHAKEYYLQLADSALYNKPGKLVVVNNTVNPTTGTIQIRLQFPNQQGLLKSGMNAVVVVKHPSNSDALAIPTKALIQTLAETTVFTLGEGNVVQSKQIVTGLQIDSLTLIEKGISPGDRIVVNGLQNIRPGDTVRVESDGVGSRQ